jgi:hypothetical protein
MPPEHELNEKFAEVVVCSLRGYLVRGVYLACVQASGNTP